VIGIIAKTMGVAWASGINLYVAVLVMGLLQRTGYMELPTYLQILAHPLIICTAGVMYLFEFVIDKIPVADTVKDIVQTFICVPAGAVLAAGAVGEVDPTISVAAGIVGGGITAATHFGKSGTRAAINASPEPFTNLTASVGKDLVVVGGLWTAMFHPVIFIFLLIAFALLTIWLLPKILRRIRKLFDFVMRKFAYDGPPSPPENDGGSSDDWQQRRNEWP